MITRQRPLKLLLTTDTVGGVWTYTMELIEALAPYNVRVYLATMGAALSDAQCAEISRLRSLTVFTSAYKLEWMPDPWYDLIWAGAWLVELERRYKPDVIHLNSYFHAALSWQAPVLVVGHSCVLSWWQAVKGEAAPAEWQPYQRAVAAGLRAARLTLAPTRAMLAALQTHYGPLARTGVIANARCPAAFTPAQKEPFTFTAGRLWDEAKNIAALAEVAPRLSWPVYVAGHDTHPYGGQVSHPSVHYLGFLPPAGVAHWLGRAAIYALPARYEPFGLSPLEAALAGCALVLGDIPSLREVWGEAALFVPPDDTEALAAALQRLSADTALRRRLATQARQQAMRYRPDLMAASYVEVYQQLLSVEQTESKRTLPLPFRNPQSAIRNPYSLSSSQQEK